MGAVSEDGAAVGGLVAIGRTAGVAGLFSSSDRGFPVGGVFALGGENAIGGLGGLVMRSREFEGRLTHFIGHDLGRPYFHPRNGAYGLTNVVYAGLLAPWRLRL